MGLNEKLDPEGFLRSLRVIQRSLSLFTTGLTAPLVAQYGDRGVDALSEAFYRWGVWRGERLRRSPEVLTNGVRADVLLANWDSPDLVLAERDQNLVVDVVDDSIQLSFSQVPFADQFTGGLAPVLGHLYKRTAEGMSKSLGPAVELKWPTVGHGESRLLVRGQRYGQSEEVHEPLYLSRVLLEPVKAIALLRRSAVSNGGFYSAVADVALERFDATGEHLIRQGLRNIGRHRGETIRNRHLTAGLDLTLENLMNDWDGPLVSVWTFEDEKTLTADRWEQNCTYCPYAAAWEDFGKRGQELGYMYDVEMHTAAYSAYHPGITVRWEKLKTRGDATCNFRVQLDSGSAPDLLTQIKHKEIT